MSAQTKAAKSDVKTVEEKLNRIRLRVLHGEILYSHALRLAYEAGFRAGRRKK